MKTELKDLIGQVFGKLKVVERRGADKFKKALWLCLCDCGKEKIISGCSLRSGNTKSCGCAKYDKPNGQFIDKTGQKFGRLYVLERAENIGRGTSTWLCLCDCGNKKVISASSLATGRTISCGCFKAETIREMVKKRKPKPKSDWTKRTHKFCPTCREDLPVSSFGKNSSSYDGLTAYCKVHHEEKGRLNRVKNWGSRNEYRLRYRHGITIEQYDGMLEQQNHKCAICVEYPQDNLKNPWHVDHDHATGRVRGILCHKCNTALGNFRDSPELLRKAIAYLEN